MDQRDPDQAPLNENFSIFLFCMTALFFTTIFIDFKCIHESNRKLGFRLCTFREKDLPFHSIFSEENDERGD